jgi:RNA polymerase sigma-70 factor, ECF subfamily
LSGNDSERILVRRALAGDEAAFERLVELHGARVYRAALAVVADPADALDVAQETWIKAWRGLAGFRGEAALATWLTRLARNAAADHLRRLGVRRATAERASGPPSVAPSLDAVEDREELRQALGGRPAAQRRVVRLRHELDLRLEEIALVLGVPEGTVKSRLHAAVSALRAWLVDGHDDERDGRDLGFAPGAPGARPLRTRPGGMVGPELRPPDGADAGPAPEPGDADASHGPPSRARRSRKGPGRPDRAHARRRCRWEGRSRPQIPTAQRAPGLGARTSARCGLMVDARPTPDRFASDSCFSPSGLARPRTRRPGRVTAWWGTYTRAAHRSA